MNTMTAVWFTVTFTHDVAHAYCEVDRFTNTAWIGDLLSRDQLIEPCNVHNVGRLHAFEFDSIMAVTGCIDCDVFVCCTVPR